MLRFLAWRTLQATFVVWGVSTIVFLLLRLSGDPTLLMVPPGAPAEAVDRLRQQLGFDQPIPVQYARFLMGLLRADLGESILQSRPALAIVLERLPATLALASVALLLALAVALPLGVASAIYRDTWIERVGLFVSLLGQAVPPFWLGLMLILLLSVHAQLLPSSGSGTWQHLILPAVTLGSLTMAGIARMTRVAVLEQLGHDYVRTARAKGLAPFRIVLRHILRNAAAPIVTIIAIDVANLLGGAVVTETIFAWPGIGRLVVDAIGARDYPIVQATVLVGSVVFVLASLAADIAYGVIDPRVRTG